MTRKAYIILILCIFVTGTVYSHSPLKTVLTFNQETKILKVNFTHKVADHTKHHVFRSTLKINSKEIIKQTLKQQDDLNGGSLVYKLPGVKPGDTITVTLSCNKGGIKKGKLTIGNKE